MTVSSFQDLCRTLLLIVFAESVVSSACPLDCQNGAACVANGGRLGQKSWICECPLGFMGRFCEQAVPEKQTQRRVVESVTCAGGLTCENGGMCADGHDSWAPTNSQAVCDCSDATELIPDNGIFLVRHYVGVHCEIPQDDYCSECLLTDTSFVPTARDFCVNNAPCRCGEDDFHAHPCDCPTGYSGRHCEFQNTEVQDCTLTCSGQGTCVNGVKVDAGLDPNNILELENGGTQDFMHCVCDEGFAGTDCEYDYIECSGNETGKYCFHGSQCLSDGRCECLIDVPGQGKVLTAGERCEFQATDACSVDTAPSEPLNPAGGMSAADEPFCVNQGVCVKDPTPNTPTPYYCECPSDYVGMRCEIKAEDQPTTTTTTTSTTPAAINQGVDVCQNPIAPTLPLNPGGGMVGSQVDPAVCFNHGVCVQESNSGLYYCQCVDGIHTGKQCSEKISESAPPTSAPTARKSTPQEERIDECGDPFEPTQALNSAGGMSWEDNPSCFNDGVCVQDTNSDLYYCECNSNTHEGKRCEKLKSNTDFGNLNNESNDDSGSDLEGAAIFGICLLVFVVGFASAICYCNYQMRKARILKRMGDGDAVGFNLSDPRDDQVVEWSAEYQDTPVTSTTPATSTNLPESTAPVALPKTKSSKVFGNDGNGYRHGASARNKRSSQRSAPKPREEEQSFYNVTLG